MLRDLYGYRFDGPFALVPTFAGRKVRSYLPLLNYTDLGVAQAHALAEQAGKRPYQIRVLNPDYADFALNDTVTMRIDLAVESIDTVHAGIAKRTRRYLRDLAQTDFIVASGTQRGLVREFHDTFSEVMYRLGTPTFPVRLFELLAEHFDVRYYAVRRGTVTVAAAVVIYDEEIAWVPWSGTNSAYLEERPGLLMYWEAIKDAHAAGKRIFDYGRSGYDSGTYEFKTRWGARPVKIDVLAPQTEDPYSKYQTAATIWKKLPRPVVDFAGPKLCKYLPDL